MITYILRELVLDSDSDMELCTLMFQLLFLLDESDLTQTILKVQQPIKQLHYWLNYNGRCLFTKLSPFTRWPSCVTIAITVQFTCLKRVMSLA